MRPLLIQIGDFDQEVVGYNVLKFTYIRLNVKQKIIQKYLNLNTPAPSII
jgi:hypothetical protein